MTWILVAALVAVEPPSIRGTVDQQGELIGTQNPAGLILIANLMIGARGVRVIRAARAVLSRGFEGEARAHDRILVELQAHRHAIMNDPSGREALGWVQRKRGHGISKRVAAMSSEELYANLCADSHGDPAPVLRLVDVNDNRIDLAPRRTLATRASLLMHAGFARDQAVLVSELSGATVLEGVEELDAELTAAWDRMREEDESD